MAYKRTVTYSLSKRLKYGNGDSVHKIFLHLNKTLTGEQSDKRTRQLQERRAARLAKQTPVGTVYRRRDGVTEKI